MSGTRILLLRKGFITLLLLTACFTLLFFWIFLYSASQVSKHPNPAVIALTVNFLLPMQQDNLESAVTVIPEIPTTKITYQIRWKNRSTVVLTLKQDGLPYGQLLTVKIDRAHTRLPFLKKSFQTRFRPPVPVSLVSEKKLENICTRGPVTISFNSPVNPEDMKKYVKLPVAGKIEPLTPVYRGNSYTDYSRWQYIPSHPLKNDTSYQILINPGLRNKTGVKLNTAEKITFHTALPVRVFSTSPADQSTGTTLYQNVEAVFDQEIIRGSLKITDLNTNKIIPGVHEIQGNKIVFKPDHAFLPGRQYKVEVRAAAKNNEVLENHNFFFTTMKMDGKYWLDVKLGKTHTVTVYKGDQPIRHMPASGGRAETPTPLGSFYTQDRGHSFWSPRFGEGATYWVRLVGQILIHSVPRDHKWQIKKDEHEKLGLPASHGCIRLSEEDAKWVYQNIPGGTLVIIHL